MRTLLPRLFQSRTWLLLILFLLAGRLGRAQTWDAAQALGTSEYNGQAFGQKFVSDGAGHLYLTGNVQGTISLGGRTLTSTDYSSFIAKLDEATGQCQWVLGGVGAADMTVDAAGDLYVAGSFGGRTLTLGTTTLTNTCTNPYGSDLYVAKLSSAGQWLWATQASGPGSKHASNLALDAGGNVYLTGTFGTGATFGTTTLASTGTDIFVAKITAAGQWQWAVKAGSEKMNYTNGLRADASGNVYVTGSFYGATASFGTTVLTNTSNVAGSGASDIFVAKLNPNGQWQWATQAGSYNSDTPCGLTLDAAGNVYVGGFADQGPASFGSITLNNNYSGVAFAAKLNAAGQWQWVAPVSGVGTKTATALTTDAAGNTYLTGFTNSTQLSFGTISLNGSGPNQRTYVAKLNTSGQWQWAQQTGGAGGANAYGLAVDASSNAYVTGFYLEDNVTFGSTTLTSSGAADLFVAKLGSTGQWQWAQQSKGGGSATVSSTAVDAAGNVYVTGSFTGTLSFGSITRTSHTLDDLFVAKRSAAGQWLWVTQTAGTARYGYYSDKGSLAVDAAGNVYLTGCFKGADATFGSTTLSSVGGFDVFVAKLNTAGQWQWATQALGTNDEFGNGIAVDATGHAYVAGSFQGASTTFGSVTVTNPSNGTFEVFAAKLDSDGQWLWASSGGGTGPDAASDIALDALGNAYVSGSTQSPSATFGSATVSNPGYSNAFVAKLSGTGQWQWAAGAGADYAGTAAIAADASGNAYVTGFFSGPATFGSTAFTSSDSSDVFVAKVNSAGQWQWAAQGGMRGSNQGSAIAVDATGTTYVTGSFRSAGGIFGSTTLPYSHRSYYDTFVAQLSPAGQWQWATSVGGTNYTYDLALSSSGQVYVAGDFSGNYGSTTATFGPLTLTSPGAVHTVGYLARLNPIITANHAAVKTQTLTQAFPNPFAHQLTVQLLAPLPGPVEVTAHDVTGRQWLREQVTLPAGQTTLPLPAAVRWPAGVYTLTVRQGTQQQVLKVVRQ
ncbi:SBBP repeat-containing protein [Hymenobacter chitinivorans]|uniref:Putative secreted protein (Por secretion system target) n=1 Tax=Hymenobacter chitinivorans DSM 11115 TaxID=1121954 RepID=A0A2M9ASP6_9BACT|nr:SBBP repeat-containing protein [Hymenobacter chitinivorans]PJJ48697.1 putative secreted protein (Por secretion system target) [Hymenobacter chitinivorans DSM 11115]